MQNSCRIFCANNAGLVHLSSDYSCMRCYASFIGDKGPCLFHDRYKVDRCHRCYKYISAVYLMKIFRTQYYFDRSNYLSFICAKTCQSSRGVFILMIYLLKKVFYFFFFSPHDGILLSHKDTFFSVFFNF